MSAWTATAYGPYFPKDKAGNLSASSSGLEDSWSFQHSNSPHVSTAPKGFEKPLTTSEAVENCSQVGVFTQVDLAEQHLQKRRLEGVLQFGENVVHHFGYGDHISTGFQRFLKKWNHIYYN